MKCYKPSEKTLSIVFGSGGLVIAYLTAFKQIIVECSMNRNSRSVRIKQGDTEMELNGLKGFDEAVEFLSKLDKTNTH